MPLMLKDYLLADYYPQVDDLIVILTELAAEYRGVPMLSRTHGQAASPSSMGKEIMVFIERLIDQVNLLKDLPIKAKFGGATGNFNAHKVAFPEVNWKNFADKMIEEMGLMRSQYTTQISHYDHFAAIFDNVSRINRILIDLCRDCLLYTSPSPRDS